MYVLAIDRKNKVGSTPVIWVQKTHTETGTETGYYWPRYGLKFKLINYVTLPVDPNELKNEWRYVPCKVLLNGEKFKKYQDAEKALSKILNEGKPTFNEPDGKPNESVVDEETNKQESVSDNETNEQ